MQASLFDFFGTLCPNLFQFLFCLCSCFICLLFFAFSTIVGWNLFGRINVNYLFGKKANLAYSIIAIIFIFLGSCLSNDLVWELTDMFNNLMVIPNAIALFALTGMVVRGADKAVKS